jgi:signal transduction histidine kinase
MGLIAALATHFQRYTVQTQIEVKFIHSGLETRLAPEIETTVYRVVQEGLTNVARHAHTSRVLVQVIVNEQLILLVQDEGQGFSNGADFNWHQSTGLSAMRERVELVGGELTIESEPNYGTTIMAQIPLNRQKG